MMEGAFYQQKNGSPTTLAVVLLMHGAALTALALAKSEVLSPPREPPLVVGSIDQTKPPPPEPVKPIEKTVTPPNSVITHVPPLVPPLPSDGLVDTSPLPPLPWTVIPEPGPALLPRIDPPAPPAAKKVEPARARANLASYVSDEDYPSSAVRNEEQGTTRFRLAVGPDGRVKDCTITSSSGSSALDGTTCRLMRQRAKFTPARNSDGQATADTVASAIRWVLPTE
jgi:protein TonB